MLRRDSPIWGRTQASVIMRPLGYEVGSEPSKTLNISSI
jgi:hypothetical protein